MNAFPPELLQHHFACMVVAGLTPPSKPSTPSTTAAAAATSSPSPSSSVTTGATPSSSATTQDTALDVASASAPADHPTSVFPELVKSLHDILTSRARNTLWDPSRGRAAVFHTVFADHNVRLPPLKTKPSARHVPPIPSITTGSSSSVSETSSSAFSVLPPRSPLSPLHPNSPQFPDGLIAPVWVRKHRELVPSVFVSFHTLPSTSDMEQLRKSDEALIKLISDRRRSLTERGIKLTIVLLTQRDMLDDAQLEARLSFIRRNSGLDSKASLFVLTPVTKPELAEFVSSLHSALFEPAADYYREHARRVKRKRTRYPPPPSTLQPLVNAIATLPSAVQGGKSLTVNDVGWLSREGWIVRSEYKLAVFAELAGDMQEAALRYREAYDLLCNSPTCLLGSTLMLPPRTKRWAEAKVLADTLSVRICKLLLYADDGESAAVFFRRHLARFTDLSTGWGIGAMTFEYWSWLAKQYRMFGELVEHATRSVPGSPLPPFQLATHAPPLPSKLLHPDALPRFSDGRGGVSAPSGMLLPNSNATSVSICPYTTVQPPGAYFYLAALCTIERRRRFLHTSSSSVEDTSDSSPLSHERKVDHTAQLTESLTKAYDSFKRNRQHRTALLVAARIATAYRDGGQDEMALKFLERILKSYRKDEVDTVRGGLVEVAVGAAVGAGDVGSAMRLLVEVLDLRLEMEGERRRRLVEALKTFLLQKGEEGNGRDETKEGGAVGVEAAFLEVQTVFAVGEVEFGAEVPFQTVIRNTNPSFDVSQAFTADHIILYFQNGDQAEESSVEIRSSAGSSNDTSHPPIVDLGTLDLTTSTIEPTTAPLNTLFSTAGSTIAFQGRIHATSPGTIRLVRATVHLSYPLKLELTPPHESLLSDTDTISGLIPTLWLLPSNRTISLSQRSNPSITSVKPKRFNINLSLTPPSSSPSTSYYIDERIPLTLSIDNLEDVSLRVSVEVSLQPSYEGSLDRLSCTDGETGKKVRLDVGVVAAGATVERVVELVARQGGGVRVVDASVTVVGEDEVETEGVAGGSLSVGVERCFGWRSWMKSDGAAAEKGGRRKALLDFDSEEEEEEEKEEEERLVGLDVEMVGEEAVTVTKVEVGGEAIAGEEEALGEWLTRDRFSFSRTLEHAASPTEWRITWSRPSSSSAISNTTIITITDPPTTTIQPSPTSSHLTVTLHHPLSTPLLSPLPLHLAIYNTHPTLSLSLIVTLESDENFTLAATRRLSIPFLLPGQTRVVRNFARLLPQRVGVMRLPVVAVRVVDGGDAGITRALADTSGVEEEEVESIVRFRWSERLGEEEEDAETVLPRVRVTL